MQTKKQSSFAAAVCVAVLIFVCKVYQHHKTTVLTAQHQQLCHQHAHLIKECMDLRAQQERVASVESISKKGHKDGLSPLTATQVIPLTDGLKTKGHE